MTQGLLLLLIALCTVYGIAINRRMKKINNQLDQLKAGLIEDVFNIYWTQPLTVNQKKSIITGMIMKFSPACRPSSIKVSDVAQIVFQTPCMTEEQLTNIGNSFMADNHETNTVAKVVKLTM